MFASRALTVALSLVAAFSVGCWEQIDDGKWFPQMKRQPAIQPFEENLLIEGQLEGFSPPEGTVAIGSAGVPDLAAMEFAAQEAVTNPVPASLASLKNGEALFARYCSTCHGPEGAGDGPVAGPPFGKGPLGLVLPIGGAASVAKGLTDGHIYTTVSLGRGRMPSYRRIPPMERWDIVNYIRELNGQGGR